MMLGRSHDGMSPAGAVQATLIGRGNSRVRPVSTKPNERRFTACLSGMPRHPAVRELIRGLLALAWCVVSASSLVGQSPPITSAELMRQWDVNRDGKVDAAEAEAAHVRMRRARNEAMTNGATDPATGRPRGAGDPAAGRGPKQPPGIGGGLPATANDDGGLILVPGTGEESPFAGPAAAEPIPSQPPRRERDALPGTRVPAQASTVPSVAPPTAPTGVPRGRNGLPSTVPGGRDFSGGDLSSRSRILPNGAPAPTPQSPQMGVRPPTSASQQPTLPRPGVIAGGARPTAPASRPAGIGGSSQNLNAGRLPAGLPQARGTSPGGYRSSAPLPATPQQFGAGASAASRGTIPQGSLPPGAVPPGSSLPYRSGMRQPVAQPGPRSQPAVSGTPGPTRVGPEGFYGR